METLASDREPQERPWPDVSRSDGTVDLEQLAQTLAGLPPEQRKDFIFEQIGVSNAGPVHRIMLENALRASDLEIANHLPSYYDLYAHIAPACVFYDRPEAGRAIAEAMPTHKTRYAAFLELALRTKNPDDTQRSLQEAVGIDHHSDMRTFDFRMMRGDLPSSTTRQAMKFVYAVAKHLGHTEQAEAAASYIDDTDEGDELAARLDQSLTAWERVTRFDG